MQTNPYARQPVRHSFAAYLMAIISGVAIAAYPLQWASAQSADQWSTPTVFYERDVPDSLPYEGADLVSDPTGSAHFAWLTHPPNVTDDSQDVIFYSRWDGERWLTPIDIFASHDDLHLGIPRMLTLLDGQLHIYWVAGSKLMHSEAPFDAEMSARAWTQPDVSLDLGVNAERPFDIAADSQGGLHVVFTERLGGLYYAYSSDGGHNWDTQSLPVANGAHIAYRPRLSVAPNGRAHVVWSEFTLEDGPFRTTGLYYAHADPPYLAWSDPLTVGGYANSAGNVLAVDDTTVYLAWNGGIYAGTGAGRFFQQSVDGGESWDPMVKFSEVAGIPSAPGMALDSSGTLHLMAGTTDYTTWDGKSWRPLTVLASRDVPTERAYIAVIRGNKVMAVWAYDDGLINSSTRELDTPLLPSTLPPVLRLVTPTPQMQTTQPQFTPTGASSETVEVPRAPISPIPPSLSRVSNPSGVPTLALSAGLSIVVVAAAALVHFSRRRK